MNFAELSKPGTLVNARGREWVVLPESADGLLMVRPVGGLDEEVTGILPAIEPVTSTTFSLPTLNDVGDFASGRILRDAARLSTRSAAGPFRCFGRIAAEPRPYQLVPLMMALKLDPIRLLIADDIGIGKTIEACLVAREMLDRGEIRKMAVLCPPHLAGQWKKELLQKFHIDAELVLSGTIQKLERDLPLGVSVFDHHPFTIVSTEFVKNPKRRDDFLIKCPEFVIVDEAHACTLSGKPGRARQQRYDLLKRVSEDQGRHLVLVTATPHSGNEDAFRSLLSLLDKDFINLPMDFDNTEREGTLRRLAKHFVQRKRGDLKKFAGYETQFPKRLEREATYTFSAEYKKLFEDIVKFAREYVAEDDGRTKQRVRYWSALALLRCVSSSPAAAAATLRSRASVDEADMDDVEEVGRRTVLDLEDTDEASIVDFNPGSVIEEFGETTRRRLLAFATRAEDLSEKDNKLTVAIKEIKALLKDGHHPIIFCRFIDTAEYVARRLREALPARVKVEAVTGLLPSSARENRIESLAKDGGDYILVATDCLSEGINLQDHFDAVMHYDLAWNPTRHEQREGRVDRYGQASDKVRVLTYYGKDNPIDGVIWEVLIRKHKKIKSALGVSVSIPSSGEDIAEALFEAALFKSSSGSLSEQLALDFIDAVGSENKKKLHAEWDDAAEREKASRSRFAQHTLKPEAVAEELQKVREAIGLSSDVAQFMETVLRNGGIPFETDNDGITVHINAGTPRSLRQAIGLDEPFTGRYELPLKGQQLYLGRTSPVVEGLASWVLDQALDPVAREGKAVAARCGVIVTGVVSARTTLVVARFRYQMKTTGRHGDNILSEEIIPLAFTGQPSEPEWLLPDQSEKLLAAVPGRNLMRTAIDQQMELLLSKLPNLRESLSSLARDRAKLQLEAHERVRESARASGRVTIEPVLPADILGAYVLLPQVN